MIDRKEIKSLSKTALECLAMGMTVFDYDGNTMRNLPKYHYPEVVAEKSLTIYKINMEKK
jgi:hypothetical protein